jgi:dipeptidyl aminopeptidase/acylaminoacyl peptidase
MRSLLLASALLLVAASPLNLAGMARIADLEEPAIAPHGARIAMIIVRQNLRDDVYIPQLVLVNVQSGYITDVVRGHDVTVPRWSPDGSRLSYLARPFPTSNRQLYVRRNGATLQLTHGPQEVIDAVWSPDGTHIAYVAADPPAKAPFFYAGDNDYTQSNLTPPDHLWIVAASGGAARQLTRGSWTIAPTDPGGIFSSQISWSPDGRRIALTRLENTFTGDDDRSTIWQIDVARGDLRKLTRNAEFEETPSFSPGGSTLLYWYPLGGDYNAENTVRLRSGGSDQRLAENLDRNIAASLWYPDGRSLLLCAADGTQDKLWTVDVATLAAREVPLAEVHPVCDSYSSSTFDSGIAGDIARDGTIAFIGTASDRARELYLLRPGAVRAVQVTHINDFLGHYALGRISEITWTGPDNFNEDGVVTYPPLARADARFPVVLLIHGGPGTSDTRDLVWQQWPLAQMIAARGFVVLQPNYRGSDNLGNAYMTAIAGNTVGGPGEDIRAGLAALERMPEIDGSRVAVSGWSYGGELTTWLIGHYHDWRAAVAGAAVTNEFDEYNLSESNVQDRYPLQTSPFADDGERIYHDNSPISYFAQITTPTLIWSTTLDPVVPITQSYELYHALRERQIAVRLAVFPAATHGPDGPRQTAELTRLWLDWLAAHMR